MEDLFGSAGARFSLTRVPLGASDYVKPTFTKDDWDKLTNEEANATYYNYQATEPTTPRMCRSRSPPTTRTASSRCSRRPRG